MGRPPGIPHEVTYVGIYACRGQPCDVAGNLVTIDDGYGPAFR